MAARGNELLFLKMTFFEYLQVGDYRVQFSYSGRGGDEFTVVGRQSGREVDLPNHVNMACHV